MDVTKRERVENFKKLGFGVFVHFGLYSVMGDGEWTKHFHGISDAEYEKFAPRFNPEPDWADKLVRAAAEAGAKYIVLTARHHDGFSLYDTRGLSDYDAPHFCGRDLAREYVDACNRRGIVPFFYHTTLDWRHPDFDADFPAYQKYLRASVEILCKHYGKIGGLWFDGNWSKRDADWEEDALYGLIRGAQPDAIIVNNTGLDSRGAAGHTEIDSVTFERGRPDAAASNSLGAEMCETVGGTWGYAGRDMDFKSMRDLLTSYMTCRRFGANFLLNVGPRGDGELPDGYKEVLRSFGLWNRAYAQAVAGTRPADFEVSGDGFILTDGVGYYLFNGNLNMAGDPNVAICKGGPENMSVLNFTAQVKRVVWLDNGEELAYTQQRGLLTVACTDFSYGVNYLWRVAKIEVH